MEQNYLHDFSSTPLLLHLCKHQQKGKKKRKYTSCNANGKKRFVQQNKVMQKWRVGED